MIETPINSGCRGGKEPAVPARHRVQAIDQCFYHDGKSTEQLGLSSRQRTSSASSTKNQAFVNVFNALLTIAESESIGDA